jgi:hypothetical protein
VGEPRWLCGPSKATSIGHPLTDAAVSTFPADVNPQLIQLFVVGHPALLADIV